MADRSRQVRAPLHRMDVGEGPRGLRETSRFEGERGLRESEVSGRAQGLRQQRLRERGVRPRAEQWWSYKSVWFRSLIRKVEVRARWGTKMGLPYDRRCHTITHHSKSVIRNRLRTCDLKNRISPPNYKIATAPYTKAVLHNHRRSRDLKNCFCSSAAGPEFPWQLPSTCNIIWLPVAWIYETHLGGVQVILSMILIENKSTQL